MPRHRTPTHLAEKIRQSRATLEGERKQVTVLFANVKARTRRGEPWSKRWARACSTSDEASAQAYQPEVHECRA